MSLRDGLQAGVAIALDDLAFRLSFVSLRFPWRVLRVTEPVTLVVLLASLSPLMIPSVVSLVVPLVIPRAIAPVPLPVLIPISIDVDRFDLLPRKLPTRIASA